MHKQRRDQDKGYESMQQEPEEALQDHAYFENISQNMLQNARKGAKRVDALPTQKTTKSITV